MRGGGANKQGPFDFARSPAKSSNNKKETTTFADVGWG